MKATEVSATGDRTDHWGIGGLYFETTRPEAAVRADLASLLSPNELLDLFVWQLQPNVPRRLVIGTLKEPIATQTLNHAKQILTQKLPAEESSTLREISWVPGDSNAFREEIREREEVRPNSAPPSDDRDWFWPMNVRLPITEYGTSPTPIKIAHIDTGISQHPCLQGAYESGKNFINEKWSGIIWWNEQWPQPLIDHGTATASLIIGASHPSDSPLVMKGMALPQNAERRLPITVVPCRVGDSPIITLFELGRVASAINWAVENGCKVISISMGTVGLPAPGLRAAVQNAHDHGVIICAAAGQYVPAQLYPAKFAQQGLCICCGPSSRQRVPWPWAIWAAWELDPNYVTISAPANEMPKATWQDAAPESYSAKGAIVITSEGSSYSTAYIASVAALWYCKNFQFLQGVPKNRIVKLFRDVLLKTCDPWAERSIELESHGPGIVNATRALRYPVELLAGGQLSAMTAAVHSGGRMQLWGINSLGRLITTSEHSSGGKWTGWQDFFPNGAPSKPIALTAVNRGDDGCDFWAIDHAGSLYCCYQMPGRGEWSNWIGPGWSGSPQLKTIFSFLEGGGRGVCLWAIDSGGNLRRFSQPSRRGNWENTWGYPLGNAGTSPGIALAAVQMDERTALWVVNERNRIWCNYEKTKTPGSFSGWVENWNGCSTPLIAICAAVHSGRRAQVWGIDLEGNLTTCYQEKFNGDWTNWRGFTSDAPTDLVNVTAAVHHDGRCFVWATRRNGSIAYTAQNKKNGDWLPWDRWIDGV